MALRSEADERLAELAEQGVEPAFEAIVSRHRPALLRHCRRLLREEDLAEDAVQQAFLNAFRAFGRGSPPRELRAWLHRVASRTAIDLIRQRSRAAQPLPDEYGAAESTEQAAERRESLSATVKAVEALPARQRRAVLLRELEGRSYDEIAAELGVGAGAVRQLLNRARTTLREGVPVLAPPELTFRLLAFVRRNPPLARVLESVAAGPGIGLGRVVAVVVAAGVLAGGTATIPGAEGNPPESPRAADGGSAAAAHARRGPSSRPPVRSDRAARRARTKAAADRRGRVRTGENRTRYERDGDRVRYETRSGDSRTRYERDGDRVRYETRSGDTRTRYESDGDRVRYETRSGDTRTRYESDGDGDGLRSESRTGDGRTRYRSDGGRVRYETRSGDARTRYESDGSR